jgi:hypothetical protein
MSLAAAFAANTSHSRLTALSKPLQKRLALLVPIGTREELGDRRPPMDSRREET